MVFALHDAAHSPARLHTDPALSLPLLKGDNQFGLKKYALELGVIALAGLTACAVTLVGLLGISWVDWPAYNSSHVSTALTVAGQTISLGLLVFSVCAYRLGRWLKSRMAASWVGISGLVLSTLGMPLGATTLYLSGISVDQQFRTEYLTRLTDSAALSDMTYADMPPYYPAGWFWLGGRFANLLGLSGWEAYKPWAIISLAIAATIGFALWDRMIRTDLAIAIGTVSTLLTLWFAGAEPYGAVLILVGLPMLITGLHALRSGSIPAIIAFGLFLGFSATIYTLYTGIFVLTTVLLTIYFFVTNWLALGNKAIPESTTRASRITLTKALSTRALAVLGIAFVISLITWAPYFLKRLTLSPASGGTAQHYLPAEGATFAFPMFEFSFVGALTLLGSGWILLRFNQRSLALILGISVAALYLYSFLSFSITLFGTSLLSFRLYPVIVVFLSAAGVLALFECCQWLIARLGDIRTGLGIALFICAIATAQAIPGHLTADLTTAYTDTDGNGVRADKRAPSATRYYKELDQFITATTKVPRNKTVVLTADYDFLAIYPYLGFQGLTSHYANPLAEFDKRESAINSWSQFTSTKELLAALDKLPWKAPRVFIFRNSDDGYTLRLATDVYPNDPNVKRYTVTYNPRIFADSAFITKKLGPFVLVIRK